MFVSFNEYARTFYVPNPTCYLYPKSYREIKDEPVLQSPEAEDLQPNINRWVIYINLDSSQPHKCSVTRKKWGERVPFIAGEGRNSTQHHLPPPLACHLSSLPKVKSKISGCEQQKSNFNWIRWKDNYRLWWWWIPGASLDPEPGWGHQDAAFPFPFLPLRSALTSFPWGASEVFPHLQVHVLTGQQCQGTVTLSWELQQKSWVWIFWPGSGHMFIREPATVTRVIKCYSFVHF